MQAYLDRETVSTPVDGVALEPTTVGTPESRGRFERLHIGDGWLYRRGDGHIIDNFVVGLNGEMDHIPVSGDFGDLAWIWSNISIATGDTYKRIPTGPYINGIHLAASGVSAHQDLQLPIPSKAIGLKDKDRDYLIHNKNATHKIKLRDWDGNVFFNVEPGERTFWRLTQEAWAYGEWASISVPTRHLVYALSFDGTDAELDGSPRLDVGSPAEGEARVLPVPASDAGYIFRHEDFFGLGTGSFASDLAIQSQTAESDIFKARTFKILGNITGFAQIDGELVSRKSSGSGDMDEPTLRIFLFRDDAISDYANLPITRIYSSWRDVPQPFVPPGSPAEG